MLAQSSTSGRWSELALKPDGRLLTIEYGQGDDVWLAGWIIESIATPVLVSWIPPYEERQWTCPAGI